MGSTNFSRTALHSLSPEYRGEGVRAEKRSATYDKILVLKIFFFNFPKESERIPQSAALL